MVFNLRPNHRKPKLFLLIALLDQPGETAAQTTNEEREFTEGEFNHVS